MLILYSFSVITKNSSQNLVHVYNHLSEGKVVSGISRTWAVNLIHVVRFVPKRLCHFILSPAICENSPVFHHTLPNAGMKYYSIIVLIDTFLIHYEVNQLAIFFLSELLTQTVLLLCFFFVKITCISKLVFLSYALQIILQFDTCFFPLCILFSYCLETLFL